MGAAKGDSSSDSRSTRWQQCAAALLVTAARAGRGEQQPTLPRILRLLLSKVVQQHDMYRAWSLQKFVYLCINHKNSPRGVLVDQITNCIYTNTQILLVCTTKFVYLCNCDLCI